MSISNFEFKARIDNLEEAEKKLLSLSPQFVGEDVQTDTYFHIRFGRLKLREGNIENALIHYQRSDTPGAKQSDVLLYRHNPGSLLKEILAKSLGIQVLVRKKRRIYLIGNVKFHFDAIKELGTFMEVEAIDIHGDIGVETLKTQCTQYAVFFDIPPSDYVGFSYSDMMLVKRTT